METVDNNLNPKHYPQGRAETPTSTLGIKQKGSIFPWLTKVISKWDTFLEISGRLLSILSFLLVGLVVFNVLSRYLFNYSWLALQELEWHLFSILFLIPMAWTLKRDQHVRVDFFYQKFSKPRQGLVNGLGQLFFTLPFSIIMIIVSWGWVGQSYSLSEASPDPGGLPARYILKAIIPISFFLLAIQALADLIKTFVLSPSGKLASTHISSENTESCKESP